MSRLAIILLVGLVIFVAGTCALVNCTRENEINLCGSPCQRTCSNLAVICYINNVVCNDTCYCKNGFARITDDKSPCIPIKDCPGYNQGETIITPNQGETIIRKKRNYDKVKTS